MEEDNAEFVQSNVKYRNYLMKQLELLNATEFDLQKYDEFIDGEAQEDLMQEIAKLLERIDFDILIDSSSMTFNYNHYNSLRPVQQEFAKLYLLSLTFLPKIQWKYYKKSWETCDPNDKRTRHLFLCAKLAEETLDSLEKN